MSEPTFGDFVREIHGWEPFPWQSKLVERVMGTGRWPAAIDVPTSLGKTLVLDAALFVAAARPDLARRRIFFVVDRRLVVDEAYEHATRIQKAFQEAVPGSATAAVAKALRQPGDDTVLEVTRMRGGVTWEARWVERPDRYAIVTGTVDQIGSRLLFRGYGVSRLARSIDAALVGNDSLIIIDEAHLSRPLVRTLDVIQRLEDQENATQVGRRPVVVAMSATAPRRSGNSQPGRPDTDDIHGISDEDRACDAAAQRLNARKSVHLVEVKTPRSTADAAVTEAMAALAMRLGADHQVVGVVANTVARARRIHEHVQQTVPSVLLIGRSRPADRDYVREEYYHRVRAGHQRVNGDGPFIVVATQTIEVGANIDFDALVTESAPIDSLVQRLGRLNRLGRVDHTSAPALVVHDSSAREDDPVYGSARLATWTWLIDRAGAQPVRYSPRMDPRELREGIPASPSALGLLLKDRPENLTPDSDYVPVLHRELLDVWVRTSPAPHPDPPVGPYLHGLSPPTAPVRIVWRAGLLEHGQDRWAEMVSSLPPASDEEVEVSLPAAKRWLSAAAQLQELGDLDLVAEPAEVTQAAGQSAAIRRYDRNGQPLVVRIRRGGDATTVPLDELAPGDLIVVPAEYGGCDRYGWNPGSTQPVVDVADLAWRRGRPTLRLGPYFQTVLEHYHPELAFHPAVRRWLTQLDEETDASSWDGFDLSPLVSAAEEALSETPPNQKRLPLVRNLRALTAGRKLRVSPAQSPWRLYVAAGAAILNEDGSPESSSAVGERVTLQRHQEDVARAAETLARNLGLGGDLAECVRIAAALHDEGKRDPRFQAMLWGGDRLRAELADEPIAKSGMHPFDVATRRRAQRQSGYPERMRHEALSARIAEIRLRETTCPDPELVIHLVSSHHGHGRPLLPPVVDPAPVKVMVGDEVVTTERTVDWDAPGRFGRLNRRYGRWGLALLETIVRLADIWCSARGEAPHDN